MKHYGTLLIVLLATPSVATEPAEPVSFRAEIAPLLIENCLACHGPKNAEGGYRVDSFERFMRAGDSESASITAGDPDDSESLRRIMSDDADERMPLEGDPLASAQVSLITRWIKEGARFDAEDPKASLASILPAPVHPQPPEAYPNTLPVTAVAFDPGGERLWVGGYHELTVWDVASGELVRRLVNVGQRVYAIRFHRDGKRLAVACGAPGQQGELRLFDAESGELLNVLSATSDVVLDAAFNPAGDRLAVAAADSVIRIFDVESGAEQLKITSHSDWVMAIAWNGDGTRLASASRDKTSKVFDTKSGELLITYAGHGQPVRGVAFHPDGAEVFTSGDDKKVHRWKLADGKKAGESGFGGKVFKLDLAGDFLLAVSADKTVRLFEAKTQKQVRSLTGHSDWVLSCDAHTGARRVASGGFDGEVRVWSLDDGTEVKSWIAAPGLPSSNGP